MLTKLEKEFYQVLINLAKAELKKKNKKRYIIEAGFESYLKFLADKNQREYIFNATHPETYITNPYHDPEGWALAQQRINAKKKRAKRREFARNEAQVA